MVYLSTVVSVARKTNLPCIPKRQQLFSPGLAPLSHIKFQLMIYPAPNSCSGNFLFFPSSSSFSSPWKAAHICTSSAEAGNLMKTRRSSSMSRAMGMCSPGSDTSPWCARMNDRSAAAPQTPQAPGHINSIMDLESKLWRLLRLDTSFATYLMKKVFLPFYLNFCICFSMKLCL